jgi:hypothetical protein
MEQKINFNFYPLKNKNVTWQNFEIITTYSKKGLKVNLKSKLRRKTS